jgi:hypothetical protein
LGRIATKHIARGLARKIAGRGAAEAVEFAGPTKGVAARALERMRRLFYKPTETGSSLLPPGEGVTTKFGDITYSTLGSPQDRALALFHERVHSFLSPKLLVGRTLRADIMEAGYKHSALLKYLEEALAETYAQLHVRGMKGLVTGLRVPVQNGYVTLSRLAVEGAAATITAGGATYGVYYRAKKSLEGKTEKPAAVAH